MKRIKFKEKKQREFLKKVISKTNSPSLRELSNRLGISYSTLKNYNNESRLLPLNLFQDLCYLSKFPKNKFKIKILDKNWGQVKGGKKGKRNSLNIL